MNRISDDSSRTVQPLESDELAATVGGVRPDDGGCIPFPFPMPFPFPGSDPLGDADAF